LNQPIAVFKRRSATQTLRFDHRGLKPTATVTSWLREADTFGGCKKLRCALAALNQRASHFPSRAFARSLGAA